MKRIFGLFMAFVVALMVHAVNVGDWRLYLAYHNALSSQPVGDEIYANFDGNLMAYHPEDEEVRLLSKLDGLNGSNVLLMGYSESEQCLALVYDNFQIDLMFPADGSVVSLPQIKDSGIDGLVAHRLYVEGEHAVLAMNNGVVHLNLKRQEVTGYYILDEDISAAAFHDGVLYAAAPEKLYACSVKGNPLDRSEWNIIQKGNFSNFVSCGGFLYGVTNVNTPGGLTTGLWLMNQDGRSFQRITDAVYPHVFAQNGVLVVADYSHIKIFSTKNPAVAEKTLRFHNEWKGISRTADGKIWASEGYKGMRPYLITGETLKPQGVVVGNYGPLRDLCYYMKYEGDRLLVAGGRLDPYDRDHYPGTIMEFANGEWCYFQEEGIKEQTKVPYMDITSVVVDPNNPDHVMASAGGTGLYEFEKYKFKKHISNHNSALESTSGTNNSPRYVRVDGLNFDEKGNLWMVNNTRSDTILRVRRPNGSWKSFYIEAIQGAPTCEKTMFDQKGRLWMASRRTVDNPRHDAGLLCLDYNGTLDNTKDDLSTYRSTFVNQDGKSYLVGGVYSMAEDRNGAIWVGTKSGLFVISNPDDWHKSGFYVTQVKVPRNDGTNLADYLLSEIPITAIAIDGADRKWVGTESNGLYLVSAEGTQVLEHFEESNSPLLSNNIYSLAPNMKSGEVMIGTDRGLCSLQSFATTPESSLDKNNIKVFPNPVRPEYHGTVKVTGLTDNADVKVVTTSGEVVAAGVSTGGTYVWDVKGGDGARVAAGVYYFMIATSDGKKGIAAKVVVI